MASGIEVAAMRRAVALAAGVLGSSYPNPPVGCVVLDANGEAVGEGAHRRAGEPHAEVVALAEAGDRARGGTAVVTLEPCAHQGRTGPCVHALAAAGIARVVFAVADPNPRAAGGAARLRVRGVDVEAGVLVAEAADVLRPWLHAASVGRPFVTWKYAATLDGRSAAADGTSRWITGEEARADVHRLRAGCDAILVGTGTALADNPSLTARPPGRREAEIRQPLRVVAGHRDLPADAHLRDAAAETLHLRTRDPAEVLKVLQEREIRHVLLEGGPTLAGGFLATGLVDEVVGYLAPALLGAGPPALSDAGVATIAGAVRLDLTDVRRLGPDLRVVARPRRGS